MQATISCPTETPYMNGLVTQHAPDITAELMTITSQMAAELLKNRRANRPISKARVRSLIEDLRAGRWRTNGESIILTEDMELLDGQHRLQAVLESGIAITALVAVGVTPGDMGSIDQGRARSGADALAASSIPRARDMAAVARWLWRVEHEKVRVQAVPLRNQDLPAFVADHPGLHAALGWGSALRPIMPMSCAAAFYYLFSRIEAGLAKEYYLAIKSGEGLTAGHPALAVRNRALQERVSTVRHAVAVGRAALLALGWNCLRASKACPHGLTWRGERDKYVPFPHIV
jgi:hypothetical protein